MNTFCKVYIRLVSSVHEIKVNRNLESRQNFRGDYDKTTTSQNPTFTTKGHSPPSGSEATLGEAEREG